MQLPRQPRMYRIGKGIVNRTDLANSPRAGTLSGGTLSANAKVRVPIPSAAGATMASSTSS